MTEPADDRTASECSGHAPGLRLRRLWPLLAIVAIAAVVLAAGWHRALTLETLVRHRMAIATFIDMHGLAALGAFVALYVAVVALSVPGATVLTIIGGALFGTLLGGVAAIVGATLGAAIIFLIARSALGEYLVRRAGPLIAKFAAGFRADAFNYLLFLRLVPVFPFWLVNLAPALLGAHFSTFLAATVLGIVPGTFAFTFVGAGLDSVIASQEGPYRDCVAAGRDDCRIQFDLGAALTPQLLAALVALGLVALIPVAVKHVRARKGPA